MGRCDVPYSMLHEELHDLTTFGTPLGPHWLTTLPQGHANTVQVYQGDTAFILQDEIPDYTSPFIDDVPVKLVKMQCVRINLARLNRLVPLILICKGS
jgi:hypothetical protein